MTMIVVQQPWLKTIFVARYSCEEIGTLVISGLINGLLMLIFCCVFATLIFKDVGENTVLKTFIPVGVLAQTFFALTGGL